MVFPKVKSKTFLEHIIFPSFKTSTWQLLYVNNNVKYIILQISGSKYFPLPPTSLKVVVHVSQFAGDGEHEGPQEGQLLYGALYVARRVGWDVGHGDAVHKVLVEDLAKDEICCE